jgi:hypothetical protein
MSDQVLILKNKKKERNVHCVLNQNTFLIRYKDHYLEKLIRQKKERTNNFDK